MSGFLEGVLSGPRWRESWVSPQSACLDHGSDELLELEKRMKPTRTYFEGREKRNRRRSVDRIEGQSENQSGVSQATRDSGRLRMSFEDRETSSSSYPGGRGRVTWASYCCELEGANQQGDVFPNQREAELRQRVRKQSLDLFVRVEILFWLRGLCLCDSEDASPIRTRRRVPAATATSQGSTNKQGGGEGGKMQ
ncbi:hypothetical protein V8C34DRAFT_317156 [Trichoderma compactum]